MSEICTAKRSLRVKLIILFKTSHLKIISLIALHLHHLLPSLLPPLLSLSLLPPPLPPPPLPPPHSPPPREQFLRDFELAAALDSEKRK